MIKKIISLVCLTAMFSSCFTNVYAVNEKADKGKITIYVSPNGGDSSDGTEKSPLRTLEGAKNLVRRLNDKETPIEVIFKEGEYSFSKKVLFNGKDSGCEEAPITYKAEDGANVVFSGTKELDISLMKPIKDKSVLSRLPEVSKNKVGCIDLTAAGLNKNDIGAIPDDCTSFADVNLYLNDVEQPISQWPNGENEFALFGLVTKGANASGSGGTFSYTETNPSKWINAKDPYVLAFSEYDYVAYKYRIASIDKQNRNIRLKYGQVSSNMSRRWKAYNLLEELDMPGEWYIDRDSMMLYYYPQSGLKNAKLELSVLSDSMIGIEGAKYIGFDGITFSKTRGTTITAGPSADYCTVKNCTFMNISMGALNIQGTQSPTIRFGDHNEWQALGQYRSTCHDWLIENNIFYNIGDTSINLVGGGNIDVLEDGNNVIRNNYFTKTSSKIFTQPTINFFSLGGKIENNFFNNLSGQAIFHSGMEHEIRYNEVTDTLRDVVDAGAIYAGRSIIRRGADVSYNFIKDTMPLSKDVSPHNRAIYYDDEICQQYCHHNIMVNGDKSITFAGSSGKVYSNTTVDHVNGLALFGYGAQWKATQEKKYDNWINAVSRGMDSSIYEAWNRRYPMILEEAKYKSTDWVEMYNVAVENNFSVNSTDDIKEYIAQRGGKLHNNTSRLVFNDFVDPDNYDYRIKKDSDLLKENPTLLSEDFDLGRIGLQKDEFDINRIDELKSFRLVYPQNGSAGIQNENLTFSWTNAMSADKYRFILAKDRNLTDIVEDTIVYSNSHTVTHLDAQHTSYYWTVYAICDTMERKDNWQADSVVYSFATNKYDTINFESLLDTISKTEEKLANIKEGPNPGDYRIGTYDKVSQMLSNAKKISMLKRGQVNQREIDKAETDLNSELENDSIVRGFVDIAKYIPNTTNWDFTSDGTSKFTDDAMSISTTYREDGSATSVQASLLPIEDMSKNVLFAFKMKIDFSGMGAGDWMGLGVRGEPSKIIYSQFNYFIVAKKDILEFQIRSAGLTGIIETAPNDFIKDGQWHDVIFGAVDEGFGQMCVLNVDGKTVFSYMDDTENQLRFKGNLTFFATQNQTISVKPIDKVPDNYDEVIAQGIKKAVCNRVGNICELLNDNDATVLNVGSSKILNKDNITDTEVKAVKKDDIIYLPLEVLKKQYNPITDNINKLDIDGNEYISIDDVKTVFDKNVFTRGNIIIVTKAPDFYTDGGAALPILDVIKNIFECYDNGKI